MLNKQLMNWSHQFDKTMARREAAHLAGGRRIPGICKAVVYTLKHGTSSTYKRICGKLVKSNSDNNRTTGSDGTCRGSSCRSKVLAAAGKPMSWQDMGTAGFRAVSGCARQHQRVSPKSQVGKWPNTEMRPLPLLRIEAWQVLASWKLI